MSATTTLGNLFFKWRSYTPIPLLLAMLFLAQPTMASIVIGLVIAVLGELTRIWAVAYAGGATRTLSPGVGRLITGGPFGHVRNPLYVGNFTLSLGLLVAAWPARWAFAVAGFELPWLFVVFLLAFALQYGFIVAVEERTLRQSLGTVFDDYCRTVHRWLPRWGAYPEPFPDRGDFKAAFRADRRSIQSTCLVLLVIVVMFIVRLLR
ncbi:MAG TPA: isoprenylcysteine carboxylmethyltransferase family protein [Candidatus Edwardsbacteria bacterium]|nr:isoprenylcysteine carboxylmethyltransferase family protein [Candidatus Edwardsbacteria bacterium]